MFDTGAGVPGRDTAPLVASLRSAPVTSGHCRARGGWSRSEKCQSQQTLPPLLLPRTNPAWTIRVTAAAVRSEDCEVSSWAIVTHSQCFLFLSASYFQSTIGQCRWRIHFLWLKSEFLCVLYLQWKLTCQLYREVLKALTKTRGLYERWRVGEDGSEFR